MKIREQKSKKKVGGCARARKLKKERKCFHEFMSLGTKGDFPRKEGWTERTNLFMLRSKQIKRKGKHIKREHYFHWPEREKEREQRS